MNNEQTKIPEQTTNMQQMDSEEIGDSDFKPMQFNDKQHYKVDLGKPVFERLTPIMLLSGQVLVTDKVKRDKKDKEYQLATIELKYQWNNQIWTENMGGIRIYADQIYAGPKSAGGKLIDLLKKSTEWKGDLSDMNQYLTARKVGVLTEVFTAGGNTYNKNIIQQFSL